MKNVGNLNRFGSHRLGQNNTVQVNENWNTGCVLKKTGYLKGYLTQKKINSVKIPHLHVITNRYEFLLLNTIYETFYKNPANS